MFILVMEMLSRMTDRVVMGGYIKSFSVAFWGVRTISVSHLLVDGTLVFYDTNVTQLDDLGQVFYLVPSG